MNRYQIIALAVAALNLALVCLFPPWDYMSATVNRGVATFDGFGFVFADQPNRVINANFLQIEILVILVNACIAWLLLRERKPATGTGEPAPRRDWQRIVLIGTALNLLLVLLFPPMQNVRSVTNALIPTFDGFFFVFGEHGKHAIVAPMLYVEVVFILVNGALLYLLFRKAGPVDLKDAARAFARERGRR